MKMIFLIWILIYSSGTYAQSVTPGFWTAKTEITLNGLPIPTPASDDCLSPQQAKNVRQYIEDNFMPDNKCKITKWDYKKPHLEVSLDCKAKEGTSKGKLKGTLTDKEFKMAGSLFGEYMGMGQIEITVDYNGHYLKKCK